MDAARRLIAEDVLDHALMFPGLHTRDYGSYGQVSALMGHDADAAATQIQLGAFDLIDPILGVSGAVAVPIHLLQNESVREYDMDASTLPQIGGNFEVQPLSFEERSRCFFGAASVKIRNIHDCRRSAGIRWICTEPKPYRLPHSDRNFISSPCRF